MEQELDLIQLWEVIRKRWLIVISIPIIATLTSGVISFYILKPVYRASSTLIVGKKAVDSAQSAVQTIDYSVLMANQQLAKTYGTIAQSRTVEQNVINQLNLPLTVEQLNNMITINPVKNTEVLEIQVENQNPELAASIANSMTEQFSKTVIDVKKVDSVSIVDQAVMPDKPVKPRKLVNILIAFAAGLMVSLGLVFLLEHIDNTVKTSNDVENLLGIPVLGLIPRYQTDNQA